MSTVVIESSMGVDRLATWEEVRSAMSVTSPGALEFVDTCDDCLEMDSELADRARDLSDEMMWLSIVGEMPDSRSN